jgi:hypothetical protein
MDIDALDDAYTTALGRLRERFANDPQGTEAAWLRVARPHSCLSAEQALRLLDAHGAEYDAKRAKLAAALEAGRMTREFYDRRITKLELVFRHREIKERFLPLLAAASLRLVP